MDKGGKIRTFQMLKELRASHHITYLTLDDGTAAADAREQAQEYAHEVVCVPHRTSAKFSVDFYKELAGNLVSRQPYFMAKYESKIMRGEIQVSARECDVLVCDFLMPSINVPHDLPCPTILFQHNVEAQIWQRHFEVQTHPAKKFYLRAQWTKARTVEAEECRRFDCVVAVSEDDARMMEREYDVKNVEDIPTGVDTDYFKPGIDALPLIQRKNNLVFTGSMDWLPNEDAIKFFVAEVLPHIKREIPDVTLTVVGRNPFASLVEISKKGASIIVTGRVEDVRPYMDAAAVYIVPLRIGGGTRLKIYEALAMELPMVSTTIGAEGLPLEHEQELLLADTPQDFANQVVRLLRDKTLAREMGARAAHRVRRDFGWGRVAEKFAAICEQTIKAKQEHSNSTAKPRVVGAAQAAD